MAWAGQIHPRRSVACESGRVARRSSRRIAGSLAIVVLGTIVMIGLEFLLRSIGGAAGGVASVLVLVSYVAPLSVIARRHRLLRQQYVTESPASSAEGLTAHPFPPVATPASPEQWHWELRHSLWVLWLIVPLGITTTGAFIYIAGRARKWEWGVAAVVYGALTAASLVIDSGRPAVGAARIAGLLLVMAWLGGLVNGLVVRRRYLSLLAARKGVGDVAEREAYLLAQRHEALGRQRRARASLPPLLGRGFGQAVNGLVLRFGIFGLGGAFLAVVMIPIAVVANINQAHFDRIAIRTTAVVLQSPSCSRACYVVAEYRADGRPVTARLAVQIPPPKAGSTIPVKYDPAHPSDAQPLVDSVIFAPFALAMAIVGAVLAMGGYLWHRLRG